MNQSNNNSTPNNQFDEKVTKENVQEQRQGSSKKKEENIINKMIQNIKKNESKEDSKNRIQIKKNLRNVLIFTMWAFFGFLVVYLIILVLNSFNSLKECFNSKGLNSMREVISIVFAFGAGSVISNQFKNFLKS